MNWTRERTFDVSDFIRNNTIAIGVLYATKFPDRCDNMGNVKNAWADHYEKVAKEVSKEWMIKLYAESIEYDEVLELA